MTTTASTDSLYAQLTVAELKAMGRDLLAQLEALDDD